MRLRKLALDCGEDEMNGKKTIFENRMREHDKFENDIMDMMRPYTTRKHLPDRFISFGDTLYAWDAKTSIFVEDSSHDEYFRVQNENGIKVFIVYFDKKKNAVFAEWIDGLTWHGPFPPSPNSTCNDPYYRIEGGRTLDEFMQCAKG